MSKVQQPMYMDVEVDPLSLFRIGYKILNGNITQCYRKDDDSYIDNRALVPLVALPDIGVYDPHGKMSGTVVLTGVDYFTDIPSSSTKIINNEEYQISADGHPQYSIKVMRNTPVDAPMDLYFQAYFTDIRINKTVMAEGIIPLQTTYYEANSYSCKIDQPTAFSIDPTRAAVSDAGWMEVELPAQLRSGTKSIADANAAYFWYVLENSTWRLLTADDLFLMSGLTNGRFAKTIKVNASLFSNRTFKCIGCYYEGTYPSVPTDSKYSDVCTIAVEYPDAKAHSRRSKGMYIAPDIDQAIECECWLTDNKGVINDPEKHYLCLWWAKSKEAGSTRTQIGHGFKLSSSSKAIGVTNTVGVIVECDVYELTHWMPLTNEVGAYLVNENGDVFVERITK